jgi:dTDP-glucose pyrophosphorylase
LVEVNGKPILGYVVDFWKSRGVEGFIFIVGGDSAMGIVDYVTKVCPDSIVIDRRNITNLVKAIALSEPYIKDKFILALGDCLNFGHFIGKYPEFGVGVCIADSYELSKSYSVQLDGLGVARLVEKPKNPIGLCGMGTYFLHERVFDYIERLKLPNQATSVDLTGALQLAMGQGEVLQPVLFKGDYINVTYPDDLTTVERLARIYNNQNITGKVLCC